MSKLKILLSPSKTQSLAKVPSLEGILATKPLCHTKTKVLCDTLKGLSKDAIGQKLKIKGKLLEDTYNLYQHWDHQAYNNAVALYVGSVFKGLKLEDYSKEQMDYLQAHLCILSAFYGILRPFDEVRPYRLDMTSQVFEVSSTSFWQETVSKKFAKADVIVNLASDEFSKLIQHPMISIVFKERDENGKLITKSTYAKMARGQMANYAIINLVEEPSVLKAFTWEGYQFSESLSSETKWIFIR